jgi:single-stranded-DNA-specific exonuclease
VAAGLTIEAGGIESFRAAFEAHAAGLLTPDLLEPVERVDAVVSGSELGLGLAEELEALEPCGMGNPAPRLLVPGARLRDVRPMGEGGRHARFTVTSGGARARAVAFGCDGRVADGPDQPLDATFRLERNAYNGAVEPRLVLRQAQPCAPAPIELLDAPGDYLGAVLAELEAEAMFASAAGDGASPVPGRTVIDRRGHSPLAVLVDAVATGAPVLAVCADVPRRLEGLRARVGGFVLSSYGELERQPVRAAGFARLVALDPPTDAACAALLQAGAGVTLLAWGPAELRFAEQMHELEYELRTSLVALYRALRDRERATGEELERLLRGDGSHARSARLAGRLIRVLAELELVSLDRELPALAIAGRAPTALERSPSFRVYAQRYEDGKRYLSSANHLPNG